jgi:excisionase family DNA binding protein
MGLAMEDHYSIREAAEILKVSESTIRRLFDEGRLEGHRSPGGHRRILKESVSKLEKELLPGITF